VICGVDRLQLLGRIVLIAHDGSPAGRAACPDRPTADRSASVLGRRIADAGTEPEKLGAAGPARRGRRIGRLVSGGLRHLPRLAEKWRPQQAQPAIAGGGSPGPIECRFGDVASLALRVVASALPGEAAGHYAANASSPRAETSDM